MKHIIHEIRQQPHHVRELATVLCTIVVVAVVVFVWFNSFQRNIYALLNPEEQSQTQDQKFAEESKSLFSSIIQVFSDGKAQIYNLFGDNNQTDDVNNQSTTGDGSVYPLPVSPNK